MDSDGFAGLRLTNTMTRRKEEFRPLDWANASIPDADKRVRLYVCGPTVYDFAHIGNARPVIVFDVLFRLLRHLYGEDRVTYVRNITDVDDKINARAARDYPDLALNEAIRKVTEVTANQFQKDAAALGCLEPTHQPRATEFVGARDDGKPDMVSMIRTLIEKSHAYEAGGEVLFDVTSMKGEYGRLSNRRLEDQLAGARVAVDAHKRNPGDFVLWKLSDENEPGWDSPWGRGRPGWHIECSVMSEAYLGKVFDIHGGGLDLIFPHHENEIAQSRCAHGTEEMAQIWMHNGFLQLEGKKMSKSDGNFVTISELLETETFGGRKWPGEVLRLAMLMTHYREPIDFSVKRLEEAEAIYRRWVDVALGAEIMGYSATLPAGNPLLEDINTVAFINDLHGLAKGAARGNEADQRSFRLGLKLLGFSETDLAASSIRTSLVALEGGERIEAAVTKRKALLAAKNFAEADRIRDELLAQGIQLQDGKDPVTGERVTTWEVKR